MTKDISLRIIRALRYTGDARWNYSGIRNPYNTLYYILEGDGHIAYADTIIDLLPGHLYLIPRNITERVWCDSHIKKAYIDFHLEMFAGYDIFETCNDVLSCPVGLAHCERIYSLCESRQLPDLLALRGELTLDLSAFVTGEPLPPSPKAFSLLPIIEEIQRNPTAKLRRADLAARFGWNETVLSRTFKQVFGYGIKEYIENLLVSRLTEELLSTNKTLQCLAEEYGFCDAYYLSAFFKKKVGSSPTAYRGIYQHPAT